MSLPTLAVGASETIGGAGSAEGGYAVVEFLEVLAQGSTDNPACVLLALPLSRNRQDCLLHTRQSSLSNQVEEAQASGALLTGNFRSRTSTFNTRSRKLTTMAA